MIVQRGFDLVVVLWVDEERVVFEKYNFDKNFLDFGNEFFDNEMVWDFVVEVKV